MAVKSDGSREFLYIISKWWKVGNVKHPGNGKGLGDFQADLITNILQAILEYLK